MAETGWKCKKCGAFNQPDEDCSCGAKKPSFFTSPLFYAIAGGGVILIILIVVIVNMVGMPERKYKEAIKNAVCKDGQTTDKDNVFLSKLQKQYKISDSKAEEWKKEVLDVCRPGPKKPEGPTVKCDQKDALILVSDGLKLIKENKMQEAESKFKLVTERCPDNDEALGNLGAIYSNQGKSTEAQTLTTKAISLNPNNPVWHLNLAEIYSGSGDKEKAFSELETALSKGAKTQSLKDYNFKNIENDPKYRALISKP